MSILEHRGIKGSVEYDIENQIFYGKLLNINGAVMYEAVESKEFFENFREAVDEYIEDCEEHNIPIKKEFKGSFNVRTSPGTHEKLFTISEQKGIKLNTAINEAFDYYLSSLTKDIEFPVLQIAPASDTRGLVPASQGVVRWEFAPIVCSAAKKDLSGYGLSLLPKIIQKSAHSGTRIDKNIIEKKYPRHQDETKK
ncbi:type II toxin-antitoxin system HicB family antitoxin [Chryseobacterium sp. ES2]|uniref:Type II toxin-antitoxin system HicB family antitoxin n=1 Tax=Chryseobacterium metallicongregator TaxID=3073042 RepID=A0ABU1E8X1_9FLAO|nr:type II toxin-antitoxin system HicB family antitoxin [Chryseobacterium sp. ES2]MDR4954238.1 type II toxin-antitoxin system HicB family antitoxin [Chryseobacterium sp. ES2]